MFFPCVICAKQKHQTKGGVVQGSLFLKNNNYITTNISLEGIKAN